jgi:outer membrane protein assembly factor BamB
LSRLTKRLAFASITVIVLIAGSVALFRIGGDIATMFSWTSGANAQARSSASGATDWSMEGANPARTRAREQGVALPLARQRAIRITGDEGVGSPVAITQNMMLVESNDYLRAIDIRSGKQRWSFEQIGSYISPAVAGKTVYLRAEANNQGEVIALDLQSGERLWAFKPRRLSSIGASYWGGHISSPVVVDDMLFVGAGKEVYALDPATGAVRWEYTGAEYVASSPAIADGVVYISDAKGLLAIDQGTGALKWSVPTAFSVYFAPVVADGIIVFTDGTSVRAVRAADGSDVWASTIEAETLIPGGVQGSTLYIKSTTAIHALDLATGVERWKYSDPNFISFPAIAGNSVFAVVGATSQTSIVVLDATTGDRVQQQAYPTLTTAAPVIAGQTLYVRTTDGRIVGMFK